MHVFEQSLHLLAGECALCQIMYSLAGLFWRNDLGCASVIPSEQTASSYIILYKSVKCSVQTYSLLQWYWFSSVSGCISLRCIRWRQGTNFTAPSCTRTIQACLYRSGMCARAAVFKQTKLTVHVRLQHSTGSPLVLWLWPCYDFIHEEGGATR